MNGMSFDPINLTAVHAGGSRQPGDQPFSEEMAESNTRRAQRFARDVNSIDAGIKTIVPKFFETYMNEHTQCPQ